MRCVDWKLQLGKHLKKPAHSNNEGEDKTAALMKKWQCFGHMWPFSMPS